MSKSYATYPAVVIDRNKKYRAEVETSKGTININLFADKAPLTVNNFVFLAKDGFYDGLNFHRVLADFMIQGGCPLGTGTGGPGYKWNDEASALGIKHEVGSLSMANAGPNSNGSQFFITHIVTDWLNGKHAVFGKVVSDADQKVVNAIRQGDKIVKITIHEE
jgi:peptidyl-prolyl cis-trans isomerase B (cyclophilin B)